MAKDMYNKFELMKALLWVSSLLSIALLIVIANLYLSMSQTFNSTIPLKRNIYPTFQQLSQDNLAILD